jgi:hypothetical protein
MEGIIMFNNNEETNRFFNEVKAENEKSPYNNNDIVVVTSYIAEKPETITLKAKGFFEGNFIVLDCMPVDGKAVAAITLWKEKMHVEIDVLGNIVRKDFIMTNKPDNMELAFLKEDVLSGADILKNSGLFDRQ